MKYEEEVIEHILREGNLAVALEVAGILRNWQQQMQKRFWEQLHLKLSRELAQSDHSEAWTVGFNSTKGIASCHEAWFTCGLGPAELVPGQHFFRVEIQQGLAEQEYPLRLGVSRSHPDRIPLEATAPEITSLRNRLLDEGFGAHEPWFLGLKDLDLALTGPHVLEQLQLRQEDFVDEVADRVWKLFSRNVDLLTPIHRKLSGITRQQTPTIS